MSKPIILKTGVINDTAPVHSLLFSVELSGAGLFGTGTIWNQKLLGYYGINASIRLRLQVNGNPFQCGLLRMCYIPCLRDMGTYTYDHLSHPTLYSQLPGVVYDVNCNKEVDMVIPYKHVVSQYHLGSGQGKWGTLYCFYYTPFQNSTGASNPDYTLWASLEDITLTGPALPIIAQGGNRRVRVKTQPKISSEEEKAAGPVQSFLDAAIPYVDAMTSVPLLSSIATPVSWIAKGASTVASWFGWSKPLNTAIPTRMRRTFFEDINHADSASNALPLSVSRNNQIEIDPQLSWNNEDEMSISYVARRSAYIGNFTWTPNSPTGSTVYTWFPGPGSALMYSTAMTYASPLAFCSFLFGMWRGSITLRFRFAKTEYHTGRLLLAFAPSNSDVDPAITITDTNYLLREVVDLSQGSEFCFTIPYCQYAPYLLTNEAVGKLVMLVLNPLTNPASTTSSVVCNVEAFGGEDIEFAFPRDSNFHYSSIVAQSGDRSVTPGCMIKSKVLGNASIQPDLGSLQARFCIGERVTSLKQLLMRQAYFPIAGNDAVPNMNMSSFKPYVFLNNVPNIDNISRIAPLYTFARGSMVFTMLNPPEKARFNGFINTCNRSPFTVLPSSTADNFQNCNNESYVFEENSCAPVHVQVPMNTQGVGQLIYPHFSGYDDSSTKFTSRSYLFRLSEDSSIHTTTILRGGADDFQLSLFVGVPKIIGLVGSDPKSTLPEK